MSAGGCGWVGVGGCGWVRVGLSPSLSLSFFSLSLSLSPFVHVSVTPILTHAQVSEANETPKLAMPWRPFFRS